MLLTDDEQTRFKVGKPRDRRDDAEISPDSAKDWGRGGESTPLDISPTLSAKEREGEA